MGRTLEKADTLVKQDDWVVQGHNPYYDVFDYNCYELIKIKEIDGDTVYYKGEILSGSVSNEYNNFHTVKASYKQCKEIPLGLIKTEAYAMKGYMINELGVYKGLSLEQLYLQGSGKHFARLVVGKDVEIDNTYHKLGSFKKMLKIHDDYGYTSDFRAPNIDVYVTCDGECIVQMYD